MSILRSHFGKEVGEVAQFGGENGPIPARIGRNFVIGQCQRAFFHIAQPGHDDYRHILQAEMLGSLRSAKTRDDLKVFIDRIG